MRGAERGGHGAPWRCLALRGALGGEEGGLPRVRGAAPLPRARESAACRFFLSGRSLACPQSARSEITRPGGADDRRRHRAMHFDALLGRSIRAVGATFKPLWSTPALCARGWGGGGGGWYRAREAVAAECGTTFLNVSAATLASRYRGDGERMVRLLFEVGELDSQAPCLGAVVKVVAWGGG